VNLYSLTTRLFSNPKWPFYLVCIITLLSQVFTAAMNILNSLIWWGRIDLDLILIGCIDSLAVTTLIAPLAIYMIRHFFNLEEMNRNLQKEIAERILAEEALRKSEMQYQALVETTNTGFVIIDTEGRVLDANLEYVRLSGHNDLEAIRGRNVLEWTAGTEKEKNAEAVRQCLKAGAIRNLEINYIDAQGKIIPVEINATVVEKEGVLRILSLCRDITDRKRMEEERVVMSKLSSTGILAGGIAHDFNNLLSVILGNIEMIKKFKPGKEEATNFLEAAQKATLEARGLTQQLIILNEGGGPNKKLTSLADSLQEQVTFTLRGSPVESTFVVPSDLWQIEVDEGQLVQVIRNIVLNAWEAMPEGGTISVGAANVELTPSSNLPLLPGDYVKISISDQGNGIPEEILLKIFDPYFSTKQRGNQKGMGLGLTICRSIIQKHGGAISVDTKLGHGTTLQVYLPAWREAPAAKPTLQELLPGTGRILVMDDEVMVRTMLGAMLRRLGYEVQLTDNGEKAIECYRTAKDLGRPFDIVLLDLTVRGGLGGKETIRELLTIDPAVKAIVFSGYEQGPVIENYRQYGFKAALIKPYQISDLKETLSRVMGTNKTTETTL
jgi:two-component system, cell cycle sensor histidine kinase and response regulator CckA